MEHSDLKLLGQRIRDRRKALGLTQEKLADLAKIDRSYIGGVERGERNITFSLLCQICTALECDVAALTFEIPEKQR
ncbi:helix-turn-helix domain-containing protein [Microvirga mediterraneensis]|uniref:Helix-turn-helix transcriptional regulator n=1 Tax=Microvirga mediterraneensis TaxID=2754695 RepID=A0A838BQY5_9HYPH|nr:helix-turn-helix transcriptional regulator [Microvirga mediterraneensis]